MLNALFVIKSQSVGHVIMLKHTKRRILFVALFVITKKKRKRKLGQLINGTVGLRERQEEMRLIDGDKYCDFLNTYPLEKAQNNFMSFYREALQKTFEFEVKAIPIEWIRNYVSIWISEPYKNFVLNMIKTWEKENETDRRR